METKFNFKSAVCTSRSQSERLLALGLKKETADCTLFRRSKNAEWEISTDSYIDWVKEILPLELGYTHEDIIPAWSLHRLLSLLPSSVSEFNLEMDGVYSIGYTNLIIFCNGYLYDNIIDCIEWLIKEGYFNKEYSV